MLRSYSELITLDSYQERLEYLMLLDNNATSPRHMSAEFYHSHTWRVFKQQIVKRDLRFDLGATGIYIPGIVIVHHINPIDEHDIRTMSRKLLDPENVITTSIETHNKIHYKQKIEDKWVERTPGDTILW